LRLVLAGLLGGIIGYQRETRDRAAGLRTHILVCLGSALLMLVSAYSFPGRTEVDPMRVAAGVITGMGFLGAGAIIREGPIVRGLTTAATLWVTCGIGLAAGVGLFLPAASTTALVFLVLAFVRYADKFISRGRGPKTLSLVLQPISGQVNRLMTLLDELGVQVRYVEPSQEISGEVLLRLALKLPVDREDEDIVRAVRGIEGVEFAKWQ